MQALETEIPAVIELIPARHTDDRGWFAETWHQQRYAEAGIDVAWVQDNESLSEHVGTVRGIHFQTGPHAQAKLVRVVAGAALDVAIDLRRSSETFGSHVARTLRASTGNQLFIPIGFGHAFCTLAPNTIVAYKTSRPYHAPSEQSIAWNDSEIGIAWPEDAREVILSDRDRAAPALSDITDALFP